MDHVYIDGQFIRDRITKLRLDKGVSEREMSLSLGMCESYVRNITTAPALPSMSSFLNICEYFDIAPADFFDTQLKAPGHSRETLNELERLFEQQLPEFTQWLKKLDKFHAGALMDALHLAAENTGKSKRK